MKAFDKILKFLSPVMYVPLVTVKFGYINIIFSFL